MSAQATENATATANGSVRTPLLSFGADRIRAMLPHRWPMLLLDRAYDVEPGKRGHGVKNVTVSEPFFAGHYPDQSIMPGVLIVESMAQLTAVVLASSWAIEDSENQAARVGYLGAIKQMKFSRLVVPGDQLTLSAELGRGFGGLTPVQVRASVGTEPAAAGTLVVSERGGPGGDGPQ
ncbi:3-hydroxyacyl-[acyl-carrier-protein] dehydratase [Catenulispora sp. GP43]|uniref:3-hydroxyacyl-ACP dehydratase FabZ n=1 Tax=Catenulispora sp. GP43 TaxID=3156263 RepID=UPI0035149C30